MFCNTNEFYTIAKSVSISLALYYLTCMFRILSLKKQSPIPLLFYFFFIIAPRETLLIVIDIIG